jgi:hypothetical protein
MFSSNSSQVSSAANYIEDVFSTWLYTGNGSTQTITNGINLSGKGGLVWIKARDQAYPHRLLDTDRNALGSRLSSDDTAAQVVNTPSTNLATPLSTGFTLGTSSAGQEINNTNTNFVSWTFRKQPKFFDVVTFTGDGTTGRTIAHNLGSEPGCIIVKRTDSTSNWTTYHRESAVRAVSLNLTDGAYGTTCWGSVAPTSTTFTVSLESLASVARQINVNSATYVAYLFAHDAGGFGLTGTDNVISCGSYTGNGSATGPVVTLGYEPQWLMIKKYLPESPGTLGNWQILDIMRGIPVGSADATLQANLINAESSVEYVSPTATGFQITSTNDQVNSSTETFIYIAIRRGPMKVPTLGTSVFTAETYSGNNTLNREFSVAPMQYSDVSWFISRNYPTAPVGISFVDRLRGILPKLWTGGTNSESTSQASVSFSNKMEAIVIATTGNLSGLNESGTSFVMYNLKRAPGFFDEVCYTGTGVNTTQAHNLGVVPELILVKRRDATDAWDSYSSALANTEYVVVNTTAAKATGATRWNSTTPTSSVFSVGTSTTTNASAGTYVAYLFATCAGVSKVGSYTGNGTTQTIDCGFTGGVRFVLIKRTDSTGDWYVYDTARGMTVLTDPYLLINSTAAETATLGSVTTVSTGFALNSAILADINISAGTYIFLAIA